ncbi:MAG TPA: LAGLIDADG family homing endonuclease [Candidatus Nanoarchaeia archaeon]|nr:LAGLIDADG family homing endonuclease [Candidatus Nanoarchaeia archaeon]
MKKELGEFFNDYLTKESLFVDKKALQSNFTPENIPHREEQIEMMANILAPALRMEKPSNIFCYGKTGCISGESLVYTNKGHVKIKEIDKDGLVLSFNIKEGRYEWSKFIFLQFENRDKLLKVTLDNGTSLIITKDHPLLTKNIKWIKADKLKTNDELVIGYELPNITKQEIPLSMARLLGFIISDGSLNRRQRRAKDCRGYWYNADKQRLRYFSDNITLLKKVQTDLRELFNYSPSINQDRGKCPYVQVISQEICQSMWNYGIPFGHKSKIVEVPEIIFRCNAVVQREFLKALFSGDGSVSTQTFQIEYYSNSKKLLEGISYLLYQEGIECKIRPKKAKCNGKLFDSYRLYIQREDNLTKFYYKIGFYSEIKQERLKALFTRYKRKGKFNPNNYACSKIARIEETYENYVYDLMVPKNHNFIANNFISHNSGKTCVSKYVTNQILEVSKNKKVNLHVYYLNCKLKKVADTEYRLIAELARNFGVNIPSTGLPTEDVYKRFVELLDKDESLVILVLDEVDQLVSKAGDGILYNLTRLNSELKRCQMSLVGISNDLMFTDNLDPRIKSSLSEEELVFPPYNALQLQDILRGRAEIAFRKGVLENGVIEKCAAYAAREHGDARRALELLRVSGELAERKNQGKINIKDIDDAEEKIEKDRVLDVVRTQPKQSQIALYSMINTCASGKQIFTGDVYEQYKNVCKEVGFKPLTQRRLSDIIAELDMFGIINARVVSKGRYGRTKEINIAIPESALDKINGILKEGLGL